LRVLCIVFLRKQRITTAESGCFYFKALIYAFSLDNPIHFEQNKSNFSIKNKVIYYKGKPVNGTVDFHYSFGSLKSRNKFINGIANGIFENYYSDGKLEARITYKSGFKNGKFESYFSNGKISIRTNYKNDIQDGLYESFFNTGTLMKRKIIQEGKEIELTEYDEKGLVKLKEITKDGYTFHESYVDGVHLFKKGKYNKERREEGKWEIYFGGEFWDDQTGAQLSYLKEAIGRLARIENYSDGYLNGPRITYHPNGQISKTETYLHDPSEGIDAVVGIKELFDVNGKITERSTYDNTGSRMKFEVFKN
jgi:antitoxin component YwqK of YwqJK toxin-antitoxin module